ncbi:hypothetical protein QW180_26575 [Vibrio sinaloensis]|nr:hypothetical protein [Vibrio sinaloensis]
MHRSQTIKVRFLIDASLSQHLFVAASVLVLVTIILFVVFLLSIRAETHLMELSVQLVVLSKCRRTMKDTPKKKCLSWKVKRYSLASRCTRSKTERYDEFGQGVKQRIVTTIENQIALLSERRNKEVEKSQHQLEVIDDDLVRLSEEAGILSVVVELSEQELSLAQSLVDKQQVLVNKQFISAIELQRQKLELITLEAKVQTQRLSLQRLVRKKAKLEETKDTLQLELDIALQEIDRQLQQIAQNKIEYFYQTDTQVVSPINGVAASIFRQGGSLR